MLGKIWNWLNGNDATPKNVQQRQGNHAPTNSSDDGYTRLLKKYFCKYGDLLFENDKLLSKLAEDVERMTSYKKPLQLLRIDLKRITTEISEDEFKVNNGISGVWIQCNQWTTAAYRAFLDTEEIMVHEITADEGFFMVFENVVIAGNIVYYMEYPIPFDGGKKSFCKSFLIDASDYRGKNIDNDYPINWKSCKLYDMGNESNTWSSTDAPEFSLLNKICRVILFCISVWKCSDNNKKLRESAKNHADTLNPLLKPYGISTEITEKGWKFFYNGAQITLEEAIRKIPDDDLLRIPKEAPTPPQSQPKPSTPSPVQTAPKEPPKAPSKPSAPQEIATPTVSIPFDLRYLPDLTFYSQEKAATVFPNTVGDGQLLIRPSLSCNFAKLGLIIDNYLVQFEASGYMHILNIVTDEYQKVNLSTVNSSDKSFQEWVMQISSGAPALDRVIKNDQKAYKYLIAYSQLMYHHTYQRLSQDEYNMYLRAIQAAFGIPRNGNTLEIKNRVWYYNGAKQTWGQVAHSLFRDEKIKSQAFDFHSL